MSRKYTIKVEPLEEGGYMVTVPALPGVITYGETLAEAEKMADEAIALHLSVLADEGLPFPQDKTFRAVQRPSFFQLQVST